jgi:hypothetical protein
MAKGERITVAAFNAIRNSASTVLGTGAGTSGYGQYVSSIAAVPGQQISRTNWNNLRTDMSRCWSHQTGSLVTNTLASVSVFPPALQEITLNTIITDLLFTQYSNFNSNTSGTGIVQRKDTHSGSQLDTNVNIITVNPSRTTAWNGTISSTITVTFGGYTPVGASTAISGENHMRCFFNAGGSVDIQSSRAGGTTTGEPPTKNQIWSDMLTGVGKLSFKSNATSTSNTVLNTGYILDTSGFHNASLTFDGTPVTILNQPGPAGSYTENDYNITVQKLSNGGLRNQLRFVVTFRDDDAGDQRPGIEPGPAIDENVDGTLTITPTCTRPFGSNVDVPAPTATGTNPA